MYALSYDRRSDSGRRWPTGPIAAVLAIQAARRMLAVINQLRVRAYLRRDDDTRPSPHLPIAVVVPVLDEADVFDKSLAYFKGLVSAAHAELYIVTSDREFTINERGSKRDTVALARAAGESDDAIHVHLPDLTAHKGDQVNWAATVAAQRYRPSGECLVVVYDIDSRPDIRSLAAFRIAAAGYPGVNVFHQSARFEMRVEPRTIDERIADAGALRANRFVLSTELPRLLARRPNAGRLRSLVARCTYGHVTGHGLCVRLSFLLRTPLPAKRAVEDMHWSFILATRGEPVLPLACLDRSDVPNSALEQLFQMERWFLGPARAISYTRDPLTPRGGRRFVIAGGALALSAEWLSAAMAVPALVYAVLGRAGAPRVLLRLFSVAVLAELVLAEATLGEGRLSRRVQRVALYPVAVTVFGVAGWISIGRAISARSHRHKTCHAATGGAWWLVCRHR